TTVDFDGLAGSLDAVFTGYTESGVTVTPLSDNWVVDPNTPIGFMGPQNSSASISVTDAGAPFMFTSSDFYSDAGAYLAVTGFLKGNQVYGETSYSAFSAPDSNTFEYFWKWC
ncbi:MAG TPA: hypothetical protein VMS01_05750, partial [Stellaceae bacterium]|nr:hypothetical protein [Stellaceae bacterium]